MKKKSALLQFAAASGTAEGDEKIRKGDSRFSVSTVIMSMICIFLLSSAVTGCVWDQQPELFNIHWRPVSGAPESVFLIFTPDRRRVVGCCGSNRFFGPAEFKDGSRMSIGMLGATRMASPHFRYEQKFMEDLQAARSYRFEKNGDLTLLDIDGHPCMRLRAQLSQEQDK